jgi:hypothetical protein
MSTGRNLVSLADLEHESRQRFARSRRRRLMKSLGLSCAIFVAGGINLKVVEAAVGSLFEIGQRMEQRQAIALLDPVGYGWTRLWSSNDLRTLLHTSRASFELTRALAQIPDRQPRWMPAWIGKPALGREEAIAIAIHTIASTPIERRPDAINWLSRVMSTSGLAQDTLYWLSTLKDRQLRNMGDPEGALLGTVSGRAVLFAASEMTSIQLAQCKAAAALSGSDWEWAIWAAHLSADERARIMTALHRR